MANPASRSAGSSTPAGPMSTPPKINGHSAPGEGGASLADGIGPSRSRSASRMGQVVYADTPPLGAADTDPNHGAGRAGSEGG
jgi:hypothetical protein